MAFDKTEPVAGSYPNSAPIRENFQQLAKHHVGNTEPPDKELGFLWWDTSSPTNQKLRGYTGSGWVDLFDHMESTPIPSSGNGVVSWQGFVKDKDLTAPPGSPSTGDRYIVAAVATGDWTGEENNIAEWNGGAWTFSVPDGGWAVWVEDEGEIYVFNGASWEQESFGPHATTHENGGADEIDVSNLIGLLADSQNPLAHVLVGALHTASGLTPGDVLTALSATTFGFQASGGGGVVEKAIDHTWEGDGTNDRIIDLADDYDRIDIWEEEPFGNTANHLALAWAFRSMYGANYQSSLGGMSSILMSVADGLFQGKQSGGDVNKIKLGSSGTLTVGTNDSGQTYRLIGVKFSSME